MTKYLIHWDAGYGKTTAVVDVEDEEKANEAAYDSWKEEAESNADWGAEILTKENAEENGHEDELEEAATK